MPGASKTPPDVQDFFFQVSDRLIKIIKHGNSCDSVRDCLNFGWWIDQQALPLVFFQDRDGQSAFHRKLVYSDGVVIVGNFIDISLEVSQVLFGDATAFETSPLNLFKSILRQ